MVLKNDCSSPSFLNGSQKAPMPVYVAFFAIDMLKRIIIVNLCKISIDKLLFVVKMWEELSVNLE